VAVTYPEIRHSITGWARGFKKDRFVGYISLSIDFANNYIYVGQSAYEIA